VEKEKGRKTAGVIIALSLAAAVAICSSPPLWQAWVLSILGVVVMFVAAVKFSALCILSFRRTNRIQGTLYGILALFFLLLIMAGIQHIIELLK
jgi:uncharacterized membrane protein